MYQTKSGFGADLQALAATKVEAWPNFTYSLG
jgi:hypothetical protein